MIVIAGIALGPTITSVEENKAFSDLSVIFVVDNSGSMSAFDDVADTSAQAQTASTESDNTTGTDSSETPTDGGESAEDGADVNDSVSAVEDSQSANVVEGSRLDKVRSDILNIVDNLPPSKYSGIIFNSSASTALPLTTDLRSVQTFANTIIPEVTKFSSGSSFASPVDLIERNVQDVKAGYPKDRILIFYFSDGDTSSSSVQEDFSEYRTLRGDFSSGYVLGYGNEDGSTMKEYTPDLTGVKDLSKLMGISTLSISDARPIKSPNIDYAETFIKDPVTGEPALSTIHADNLKLLAENSGIKYFKRNSPDDVISISKNIFAKNWVFSQNFEKRELSELFVYPLYIILAILMLAEFYSFALRKWSRGLKK
jgi:hypothetical protein